MITSLILFTLAAIANAIQQTAQHHYENSIFTRWPRFFSPAAWTNKYKTDKIWGQPLDAPKNSPYYQVFNLKYREKFLFSATLLAFTTDSFHFFQFLRTTFVILAVLFFDLPEQMSTWKMIQLFILYRVIWSGVFEIFYSKILMRRSEVKPLK